MYSKRTIIGTIVGGVITAIGIFSLITSFGIQTIEVNDTFDIGEGTTYTLNAPEHSEQVLNVTGDSFDLKLKSPANGLQIPLKPHKEHVSLQWFHLDDGISEFTVQNTGSSELEVVGTVQVESDPIFFTYHIMVIIAGLVIIGFSAGFSVRKPKGF
ncbi:MAG: hypothetical protein ACE5RJ_00425 [Nitrosopumilaceae archaeon]